MSKQFDIIIAGGGMVGATAALALAKLELSIALVEPVEPHLSASPSYDQRSVALSDSSMTILKSLDLWKSIEPLSCAIKKIHVSDQGKFGFTRINAEDYSFEQLGAVIPLEQTGPVLWQAIRERENIELFCPNEITAIEQTSSKLLENQRTATNTEVVVTVSAAGEKDKHLTAAMLLAADGTFSPISKMMGFKVNREFYKQHAVIANISTEKPHNNQAFERFTTHGPLALLPMTRNRMSLVWCQPEQQVDTVMNYDDQTFMAELQSQFGYRLGRITKVGERNQYPLALHLPEKLHKNGVLLIGNAAHTLHPIAGQGFNIGLRDVAALYEQIQTLISSAELVTEKACVAKKDIRAQLGSVEFMTQYTNERGADWDRTIGATDGLVRLFSHDFLPLVILRNKALAWIDKLPWVKRKFSMAAMGYAGRSTKLARGLTK
jgi:2-octaprenyl-6-methoxyphenol hydroxylase